MISLSEWDRWFRYELKLRLHGNIPLSGERACTPWQQPVINHICGSLATVATTATNPVVQRQTTDLNQALYSLRRGREGTREACTARVVEGTSQHQLILTSKVL